MARKQKLSPTPAQIVQRAKPGWKVVEVPVADAARRVAAEACSPEMDDLRRKYLGPDAPKVAAGVRNSPNGELRLLQVEPKTPTDSRVGRKVVVVDKKGIVGEQADARVGRSCCDGHRATSFVQQAPVTACHSTNAHVRSRRW